MNAKRSRPTRLARGVSCGAVACGLIGLAHLGVVLGTRIEAPVVHVPGNAAGHASLRVQEGLRELFLEGTPEAIGAGESAMLHDEMVAMERQLWSDFEHRVPWWIARTALQDWSRVRYRHVDRGVPESRRLELAAQASTFVPDPFSSRMPTYQRMLFLHALYDLALPLENSRMLGCTSFSFAANDGHEIVARAFDFEADDGFDRRKVVHLARESGLVPFASVSWPGFEGVVTGMNAEGLLLVVHGARAGEPSSQGMPVGFSLRDALSRSRDAEEALAILVAQPVMVPHLVFVADPRGDVAIVERAPGVPAFVRRMGRTAWLTNTFEGPLSSDPKNEHVREFTTSADRADRIRELLGPNGVHPRGVPDALALLRDHACSHAVGCPLGDRRAVDALIAAHGVVADLDERVLWVSVGPHLSGKFVALDLATLLAAGHDPAQDPPAKTMPEDPILFDGRYAAAMEARAAEAPR